LPELVVCALEAFAHNACEKRRCFAEVRAPLAHDDLGEVIRGAAELEAERVDQPKADLGNAFDLALRGTIRRAAI
jgi:hypothetical protein